MTITYGCMCNFLPQIFYLQFFTIILKGLITGNRTVMICHMTYGSQYYELFFSFISCFSCLMTMMMGKMLVCQKSEERSLIRIFGTGNDKWVLALGNQFLFSPSQNVSSSSKERG